jgi:hypothetical protein
MNLTNVHRRGKLNGPRTHRFERTQMPSEIILEFEGVTTKEYEAVNAALGIDMGSGQGDWPPGLQMHAAGLNDNGHLVDRVGGASPTRRLTPDSRRAWTEAASAAPSALPPTTASPTCSAPPAKSCRPRRASALHAEERWWARGRAR